MTTLASSLSEAPNLLIMVEATKDGVAPCTKLIDQWPVLLRNLKVLQS